MKDDSDAKIMTKSVGLRVKIILTNQVTVVKIKKQKTQKSVS